MEKEKNIFLKKGRQNLQALKPGDSQAVYFEFDLKNDTEGQKSRLFSGYH